MDHIAGKARCGTKIAELTSASGGGPPFLLIFNFQVRLTDRPTDRPTDHDLPVSLVCPSIRPSIRPSARSLHLTITC